MAFNIKDFGNVQAADGFNDNIDIRICDNQIRICRQHIFLKNNSPVTVNVDIGDAFQVEHSADAGTDELLILDQDSGNAGSNRSATQKSNVDCFHAT